MYNKRSLRISKDVASLGNGENMDYTFPKDPSVKELVCKIERQGDKWWYENNNIENIPKSTSSSQINKE